MYLTLTLALTCPCRYPYLGVSGRDNAGLGDVSKRRQARQMEDHGARRERFDMKEEMVLTMTGFDPGHVTPYATGRALM